MERRIVNKIKAAKMIDDQAQGRIARNRLKEFNDPALEVEARESLAGKYGAMAAGMVHAWALAVLGSPFYTVTDTDNPQVQAYLEDLADKLLDSFVLKAKEGEQS